MDIWIFIIALVLMAIVTLVVLSIHEHGSVGQHLKQMRQKELREMERGQNALKDKDFAKQEWVREGNHLVLRAIKEEKEKHFYKDNAFAEDVTSLADKEYK
jgi:hypothetical protein